MSDENVNRYYTEGRFVFDREDAVSEAGVWLCEAACPKRAERIARAMNAEEEAA